MSYILEIHELLVLRVFFVKIKHFDAHLMVSVFKSRGSTVLGWPLNLSIFLIKGQNRECNIRNIRMFLFGTSSDVMTFKVIVFTSDFKF